MMKAKQELEKSAFYLAGRYQAGLSSEAQNKGWPLVWRDLTKALRSRCPGFLELEYAIALNLGFSNAGRSEDFLEADRDPIDIDLTNKKTAPVLPDANLTLHVEKT